VKTVTTNKKKDLFAQSLSDLFMKTRKLRYFVGTEGTRKYTIYYRRYPKYHGCGSQCGGSGMFIPDPGS
jgi:hypothetical protein